MLQVGSSNNSFSSINYDVIARGLRALADVAATQDPPIKMYVSRLTVSSQYTRSFAVVDGLGRSGKLKPSISG